jgi:hypothetical protein
MKPASVVLLLILHYIIKWMILKVCDQHLVFVFLFVFVNILNTFANVMYPCKIF